MFCYQCQETCKNTGCNIAGMCGKKADTANLQDLLIYTLKGIAISAEKAESANTVELGRFIADSLFTTITNANFDSAKIEHLVKEGLVLRDSIPVKTKDLPDCATWEIYHMSLQEKAETVGVLATENGDVRSLRELLIYGLKGIAAYAHHAAALGREDVAIYAFLIEALASTTKNYLLMKWLGLCLKQVKLL